MLHDLSGERRMCSKIIYKNTYVPIVLGNEAFNNLVTLKYSISVIFGLDNKRPCYELPLPLLNFEHGFLHFYAETTNKAKELGETKLLF